MAKRIWVRNRRVKGGGYYRTVRGVTGGHKVSETGSPKARAAREAAGPRPKGVPVKNRHGAIVRYKSFDQAKKESAARKARRHTTKTSKGPIKQNNARTVSTRTKNFRQERSGGPLTSRDKRRLLGADAKKPTNATRKRTLSPEQKAKKRARAKARRKRK